MTHRGHPRYAGRAFGAAACTVALAAAWGVAPLAAQQHADQSRWSLDGSRGSFCIWYLADPAIAAKLADHAAPASAGDGLPRALTQVIRDEPKFAQWVPGVVCVGFYDSVRVGTKVTRAKPDHPVLVVTEAIKAAGPRHVATASYLLLDIATDRGDLARAADDAGFSTADASRISRPADPGQDPDVTIRLSGTEITWNGHPFGDASVGMTRSMSFGYGGERSADWSVQLQAAPDSTRPMVGALRIDGKSSLAKALKSSPIREVGPWEGGGSVDLVFQRVTSH